MSTWVPEYDDCDDTIRIYRSQVHTVGPTRVKLAPEV